MTMMAGTLMLLLTISKDKYIKCKIPFFIIYFVECILEGTYLSPDWVGSHNIMFICELIHSHSGLAIFTQFCRPWSDPNFNYCLGT